MTIIDRAAASRRDFLIGGAALALAGCATTTPPGKPLYVDSLSFLPEDLNDIRASGLSAMICDVSEIREIKDAQGVPRYLRDYETNVVALDKAVARIAASDSAYVARKGSEIGKRPGCAAFLQFQSCETVGDDLSRMAVFREKGLTVLQFTHHNNNLFAGGALERNPTGLTPLGIEGLAEMNRLRILPDVSHGSEQTMLDVARLTKTPFALSHGACKAIVNHARCASDEVIRAVADSGGAMGIFMMSFWLTRDPVPTVDHLVAQIAHVIKVGGLGAVGIANDFPMAGQPNLVKLNNDNAEGVKEYLAWWMAMRGQGIAGFDYTPEHVVIPALNNINRMETIHQALDRAGYKPREVETIMGGNWRRVLTDVLG